MRLLVGALLGGLAAAGWWRLSAGIFAAPIFARRNVRGVDVPVGVGVLLAVAALTVEAVLVVAEAIDGSASSDRPGRLVVLVAVVGFSLLGLLDDLGAAGDDRGFRGHLRALAQGRLTTGGVKLVGGGLLALVVAGYTQDGVGRLLLAAAVVALAANLGNLFDRAPGRTTKVGVVAGVVVLLVASSVDRTALTGVAVVLGAALGLLVPDLREQLMLGDAGSNVVGAVVGVAVVASCGVVAQAVVAAVLLALNLASEKVSFSKVIDGVGPLRALDRLGRKPLDP